MDKTEELLNRLKELRSTVKTEITKLQEQIMQKDKNYMELKTQYDTLLKRIEKYEKEKMDKKAILKEIDELETLLEKINKKRKT